MHHLTLSLAAMLLAVALSSISPAAEPLDNPFFVFNNGTGREKLTFEQ